MEHLEIVQFFETAHSTNLDGPDLLLGELVTVLFKLSDFLKKISIVRKIHHDAQKLFICKKGFFVADNTGVRN